MKSLVKLGAAQFDVKLHEIDGNSDAVLSFIKKASAKEIDLLVFPEVALSGYQYDTISETRKYAIHSSDPRLNRIEKAVQEAGLFAVVGFVEVEGKKIYNTAAVFGPSGLLGKYRKMHPPISGVDKFVTPGNLGYPVFSAPWGKFGVSICSDEIHPEGYRIMMLNGAQVIAHPTNLPQGIEFSLNLINPTRAIENRIYIVAANRAGKERNTRYIGLSSIYSFDGNVLACAGPNKNELVFADADLALAGEKHVVLRPGKEEWDIVRDRRPEYYGKLVEKKS